MRLHITMFCMRGYDELKIRFSCFSCFLVLPVFGVSHVVPVCVAGQTHKKPVSVSPPEVKHVPPFRHGYDVQLTVK